MQDERLREASDERPVSSEDVVWCYRNLLKREPESPAMVERHAAAVPNFHALVVRFVTSEEFRKKSGVLQPPPSVQQPPSRVPLDCLPMHADVDVSLEQLTALRDRTAKSWAQLGETEPHFSVLTGEEFRPANMNDEAVEKFYGTGVVESRIIEAVLERYGFHDTEHKICVEYGCGLGRVTMALSKYFEHVYGYDVSAPHLKLAEERRRAVNCDNVDFILLNDLEQEIQRCDFFYSKIVFQHNPPPVILVLIETALNSLKVGGIAIFQVPTYGTDYSFHVDDYLRREWQPRMETHCFPQARVFDAIQQAGCELLEIREDDATGKPHWVSNTFVVRRAAKPAEAPAARRSKVSTQQ